MNSTFIVGLQYGDEGKGKFTDLLAPQYEIVARYNGGNNSGHTIIKDGKKLVTHILPSGITHDRVKNVIARGTVVNPQALYMELQGACELFNIDEPNLIISDKASVICPYHVWYDRAREESKGGIGTTQKGIGPAYEDFFARNGIVMGDILSRTKLERKLNRFFEEKKDFLGCKGILLEKEGIIDFLLEFGKKFRPYIWADSYVKTLLTTSEKVLFEGAQSVMLDVIHGQYPYVTSSSVLPQWFFLHYPVYDYSYKVLGVMKAYTTRVGEGPFITLMEDEVGDIVVEKGSEYGSTTGRKRKCGWLDLVQVWHAVNLSNVDELILTKIDVLSDLEEIKVCIAYQLKGESIFVYDLDNVDPDDFEPVYRSFKPWKDHESEEFKDFLGFIESFLETPVRYVSYGFDVVDVKEI